jgi:hypothetical protein
MAVILGLSRAVVNESKGPVLAKPSTLIRHPPAEHEERQGQSQTPPDWQCEVHDGAKNEEEQPEDLFFHQKNLTTDFTDYTDRIGKSPRSRVIADIGIARCSARSPFCNVSKL